MSTPQNFRAAFNGFNRDDVVNYISFITSKHETLVNQLRNEIQELRQELEARPEVNQELEAQLEQMKEEMDGLRSQLEEKETTIAMLQEKLDVVDDQEASVQEQELAAYRRAESAERRAMERVDQMFCQATGILGEIVTKLQDNTDNVNQLAEQVRADLEALENAAAHSKVILEESTAMMSAIQP